MKIKSVLELVTSPFFKLPSVSRSALCLVIYYQAIFDALIQISYSKNYN